MPSTPASSVTGISWPAIVSPRVAHTLAGMYQLEKTQWWPEADLRQRQFQQLQILLHHAFSTTGFYRDRLTGSGFNERTRVTPDLFATIPLLSREDLRTHLADMNSRGVPKDHGRLGIARSSGSTGKPVKIFATSVSRYFWQVFTLRDHLWHDRDFSRKHADIRIDVTSRTIPNWGSSINDIFTTGPGLLLDIKEDIDSQIDWVRDNEPGYLLSYPSNLREMARRCLERDVTFPGLMEIRTLGETVTPEIRDICRQAWKVDIKDMYSAMEIGYMALQCPRQEQYHVMAEGVYLEVLDDNGRPCPPGEIGRVVVTDLHNFATPIIRYEILDYAEVGRPCPCGRGLPVLKRIMGRRRNMMTMPDGTTRWPSFGLQQWLDASNIVQIQIVQKEIDRLVIRLVTKGPLNANDEQKITDIVRERLAAPFRIDFEYPEAIPKNINFKFDLFVSEV